MNIIWRGQFCFQVLVSRGKNNQVNIIIDPFDETSGLKIPKLEGDILLVSHNKNKNLQEKLKMASTNPFLISGPGEYEIKDVFVRGIYFGEKEVENTVYIIEAEGLKLCHLGKLVQKNLTEEQIEKIGQVDILTIPIGTREGVSAKEALKIITQIEPKITLPMYYLPDLPSARLTSPTSELAGGRATRKQAGQIPKLSPLASRKLDGLDEFFKILGIKKPEPLNKLSIKKKDVSLNEAKIVILKPS